MMRKNLCAFALLALMTAAVLPMAARAETTVRHFHGISAYASFLSFDSTGCILTYTDLSVFENLTRTPGNAEESSYVFLTVQQYDSCQNIMLSYLSGFANLAPAAFDTRGKLNGARLVTTMEVDDSQTGSTVPVSVDLTWAAVGEVVRGSTTFRSVYPNERLSFRQIGSSTMANVTGTLLVGGTNMTSQPADYGTISDNQTGSVSTTH